MLRGMLGEERPAGVLVSVRQIRSEAARVDRMRLVPFSSGGRGKLRERK